MYSSPRMSPGGLARAIVVHRNVGGGNHEVRRLPPERDGVAGYRVRIGPFNGFACVNHDGVRHEALYGERLSSTGSRCNLLSTGSHVMPTRVIIRIHVIVVVVSLRVAVCKYLTPLLRCLIVVEVLIVRKR